MKKVLFVLAGACLLAAPAWAQSKAKAVPTFNKDVAPILFANCLACHREGEIAPMPLTTYQEVRPWAKGIKAKVMARESSLARAPCQPRPRATPLYES